MIVRISGSRMCSFIKDNRKNQCGIRFKNGSNESSNYDQKYKQQQDAVRTGIFVILGAVLFVAGCFFLSGVKK